MSNNLNDLFEEVKNVKPHALAFDDTEDYPVNTIIRSGNSLAYNDAVRNSAAIDYGNWTKLSNGFDLIDDITINHTVDGWHKIFQVNMSTGADIWGSLLEFVIKDNEGYQEIYVQANFSETRRFGSLILQGSDNTGSLLTPDIEEVGIKIEDPFINVFVKMKASTDASPFVLAITQKSTDGKDKEITVFNTPTKEAATPADTFYHVDVSNVLWGCLAFNSGVFNYFPYSVDTDIAQTATKRRIDVPWNVPWGYIYNHNYAPNADGTYSGRKSSNAGSHSTSFVEGRRYKIDFRWQIYLSGGTSRYVDHHINIGSDHRACKTYCANNTSANISMLEFYNHTAASASINVEWGYSGSGIEEGTQRVLIEDTGPI